MLGVLEADYEKSAGEIFCDILCYMKDNPEWIDTPGEAITGIGRAGVARTIMGVLMHLQGLEDEHVEGTRALIEESFPTAHIAYNYQSSQRYQRNNQLDIIQILGSGAMPQQTTVLDIPISHFNFVLESSKRN